MGEVYAALEPGTIEVWRASLDQHSDVVRTLETLLSDDERDRRDRFHFDRDRTRYVVGRGLLRALLGRYLGEEPAGLEFRYSRYRKPSLAEGGPHFNLAHSGSTAFYAFSPAFEVGIDVELVQVENADERVARRFFSSVEVQTLMALPEAARTHAFFSCWTRKEAFLKARGDGLTLALDSFDVTLAPGEPAMLLRTGWSPDEHARWQLADVSDVEHGQVAALAAPATGWRFRFRDIDTSTVINS
jgi:4'-phosphopantetheinyl transferase